MLEELWMVMVGGESKNTKKYVQEKKWTIARAYHKGLKIIESLENEGQWETGYRYVEIFKERFVEDRAYTPSLHTFAIGRHNDLVSILKLKRKLILRNERIVRKP
jgi:hypothetical protein